MENSILPAKNSILPAEDSILPADNLILPAENSILPAENLILPAENSILKAGNLIHKADSSSLTKSPIHEADSEEFETSVTDYELPCENPSRGGDVPQQFTLKISSEVGRSSDSDNNTVGVDQADPSTLSPVRTPCGGNEDGTSAKDDPHPLEGGSVKGTKQSTGMLMSPEMQEQLLFHQMLTPHNLQLFQHQRNLLIKQNQVDIIIKYPFSFVIYIALHSVIQSNSIAPLQCA